MRPEVKLLVTKGRFPNSKDPIQLIEEWEVALNQIVPPTSNEEALTLIKLLPSTDDDCYGLVWTLIHIIESAPGWPLRDGLSGLQNPWVARLRQAAEEEMGEKRA